MLYTILSKAYNILPSLSPAAVNLPATYSLIDKVRYIGETKLSQT